MWRALGVVPLLAVATVGPVMAEDGMAPASSPAQPEIRRFGDWEVICEGRAPASSPADGKAAPRACKAMQRQVAKETGQTVFLVTVLPAGHPNRFAVIVSTPLGGYLAPGMVLSVDRGRPFKVLFETCNASGCHGGFDLSGRIAREIRQGRGLSVRLWTGKGQAADVAVPLAGFNTALASLGEVR